MTTRAIKQSVYCVAYHGIGTVINTLRNIRREQLPNLRHHIVLQDTENVWEIIESDLVSDCIPALLFPSLSDFRAQHLGLAGYECVCLVFDLPHLCAHHVSAVRFLDATPGTQPFLYTPRSNRVSDLTQELHDCLLSGNVKKLKIRNKPLRPLTVIDTFLKATCSSITQHVVHYLQSVSNEVVRTRCTVLILAWLLSATSEPIEELELCLRKQHRGDNAKLAELLSQIRVISNLDGYRRALCKCRVRTDKTEIPAIAQEFGVDPFDIRYMLSLLRKSKVSVTGKSFKSIKEKML